MGNRLILCLLAFTWWSCSSDNDDIDGFVDPVISLDTAPSEYKGYVYKYNDLDYDYLLSVGFDERCKYATVYEDTLKKMTTEALAQCCLFWPVCGNHIFYPNGSLSIYDGFLISFDNCNVLQELAKRDQGAIALLKLYMYLKYGNSEYKHNWYESDIAKLNDKIRHKQHLEMLFITEYFTPNLSKDMLVMLAERGEELLLKGVDENGRIHWLDAQYTYMLWQRILLCYDKFTHLLSDEEKVIFTQNIEDFGLDKYKEGLDQTYEYRTIISEKVRLMYESYQKDKQ